MPLSYPPIPAPLRERVRRQPDAPAYTFVDCQFDPAGDVETLTWSQVHRRAQLVAAELASCGSPGDRATIQGISGGRVAAISVPNDDRERLVAIVEHRERGESDGEIMERMQTVKRQVTAAISKTPGLRVADLVLVGPGSIPITTSGRVGRSACADSYLKEEFIRLDTPA